MTRTHKGNDRDHQGIADGTAAPHQYLPKYFAKTGHVGEDPKKPRRMEVAEATGAILAKK